MATSKDDDDFVTVLECVKINDKESAFFLKECFSLGTIQKFCFAELLQLEP